MKRVFKYIYVITEYLTGCGICAHSNFDRKEVPNVVRPLNGMSAWTAIVFPGMLLSSGPD